jgi:hypothetical protein
MWAHDVETDEYAVRIASIEAGLEAAPSNRPEQSSDTGASVDGRGQGDADGPERE